MPVRTRDWLKFGTLVAIAFVFGLAFASTLNLPKKSGAAETLVVPPLSSQPAPAAPELSAPAIKSAGDFQDAFVAVAEHVKPSVVFIDRKSTRLNSSHEWISYAVFCLKKKNRDYVIEPIQVRHLAVTVNRR